MANKQLTGIFRDFSDGPKGLQRTKTKKNVFGFFNGIGNFG